MPSGAIDQHFQHQQIAASLLSRCYPVVLQVSLTPHTKTRENTRALATTVHGWQVVEM